MVNECDYGTDIAFSRRLLFSSRIVRIFKIAFQKISLISDETACICGFSWSKRFGILTASYCHLLSSHPDAAFLVNLRTHISF